MTAKSRKEGIRVEDGRVVDRHYMGPVLIEAIQKNILIKTTPSAGAYKGVPVTVAPFRDQRGTRSGRSGLSISPGSFDLATLMEHQSAIIKQVCGKDPCPLPEETISSKTVRSMPDSAFRVIEILERSRRTVSGETISNELGMTRSAVWKHINELRMMGYDISSSQKEGYRLTRVEQQTAPVRDPQKTPDHVHREEDAVPGEYPLDDLGGKTDVLEGDVEKMHGTVIIAEEQTVVLAGWGGHGSHRAAGSGSRLS